MDSITKVTFRLNDVAVYVGVNIVNPKTKKKGVDYQDKYPVESYRLSDDKTLIMMILKSGIKFGPGVQKAILPIHGARGDKIPITWKLTMAGYAHHPELGIESYVLTGNVFNAVTTLPDAFTLRDPKTKDECVDFFPLMDVGSVVWNARTGEVMGISGPRINKGCFLAEGIWQARRTFIENLMAQKWH